MNGKQLKNSILQWAIQGKLVPQDPNDEPASVLLESIRQEKERLIKEKKIKRDKNASIIYRGEDNSHYEKLLATGEVKCIDEEIPFEVPKGWEWSRVREIIHPPKYGTSNKSAENGEMPVLRMGNIQDGEIVFEKLVYSNNTEDNSKYSLINGDLLFNRTNSAELVGKTGIYRGQHPAIYAGYIILLRPILVNSDYLNYILGSSYARSYCKDVKTIGVQQCNINAEKISDFLIPIAPYAEQKRIAHILQRLQIPLANYKKIQEDKESLSLCLHSKLKRSILQEAIQGKLVPQIPEEGTAQVVLDQIQTEKQKLVKEGRLKKSALTDSVIYKGDDNKYYEMINEEVVEIELPYDYPDSWCIVRLKDVCQLIDGLKMTGKGVCLDAKYLRGKSLPTYLDKGRFVCENDSIILVDGENSGEVFTVPEDGYMGSTFKQLWLSTAMYKPYLLAFILFYKEALRNSKRGAAIPHLNKDLFYNLPIGIPPYKEQERISQRINVLFQLLK
ncbi:MAG: restriction endonuclease subunit S [Phocaeicola sp.]